MYEVFIPASVAKQIRKLPHRMSERVLDEMEELADDPRPPNCKKLTDEDLFRIRVGDYRVVYAVDDSARRVIIVRVGHRREVYR